MYFADTESTTVAPIKVWLWGIKHSKKGTKYLGYDIKSLTECLFKLSKNITKCKKTFTPEVIFFNAKWDNSFILDYMLKNGFGWKKENEGKNGYVVPHYNEMGYCYSLDIFFYAGRRISGKTHNFYKKIRITESFHLLGGSIKSWGKFFNMPKGETPLYPFVPKNFVVPQKDIDYLWRDIEILEKAWNSFQEKGMKKRTKASNALYQYKYYLNKQQNKGMEKCFRSKFPILENDFHTGYRGGWTFVNPLYKGIEVYNLYYYDIKSSYPHKLRDMLLPYGIPTIYQGYTPLKRSKLYIYNINIHFKYKPFVIPFIRIKSETKIKYPKEYKGELQVTIEELNQIKKHCNIYEIEYINTYEFKSNKVNFKQYIDYWYQEKARCELAGDDLGREIAKIMLNALYGKFGSKISNYEMECYLKDDKVSWRKHKIDDKDPIYTPVAMFVTAYSRSQIINTCEILGWKNVVYCDTDSIFSFKKLTVNVGNKLGQWEDKAIKEFNCKTIEKATFFETKQYAMYSNGISDIKCAGLKKRDEELTESEETENETGTQPFVFNKKCDYNTFVRLIKDKKPIEVKKRRTVSGGSQLYNTTFIPRFSEKSISVNEYIN